VHAIFKIAASDIQSERSQCLCTLTRAAHTVGVQFFAMQTKFDTATGFATYTFTLYSRKTRDWAGCPERRVGRSLLVSECCSWCINPNQWDAACFPFHYWRVKYVLNECCAAAALQLAAVTLAWMMTTVTIYGSIGNSKCTGTCPVYHFSQRRTSWAGTVGILEDLQNIKSLFLANDEDFFFPSLKSADTVSQPATACSVIKRSFTSPMAVLIPCMSYTTGRLLPHMYRSISGVALDKNDQRVSISTNNSNGSAPSLPLSYRHQLQLVVWLLHVVQVVCAA